MNKRTSTTVNVDDSNEFPPLTTTKSSTNYTNTILNFLQAAKKVPEPEPEEQSLMNTDVVDADAADEVDVEPFKKGCSFYTDEELIIMNVKKTCK